MATRTMDEIIRINEPHFKSYDRSYDKFDDILEYKLVDQNELKLDDSYQRPISPTAIKQGGRLNFTRLNPLTVCERPIEFGEDGGLFVVDGQHRYVRSLFSDYEGKIPVAVYKHTKDTAIADCVKYEADLFKVMNSNSLKVGTLDKVRAGVIAEHKEDIQTLDVMVSLNLYNDNFGSTRDDCRLIAPFGQFHHSLWKDYHGRSSEIAFGLQLLDKVYGVEENVHASALRGFSLIGEFYNELTNQKQEQFKIFLLKYLKQQCKTINQFVNGYGTYSCGKYCLHDTINRYNGWQENDKLRIGETTLNKLYSLNPRFKPVGLE